MRCVSAIGWTTLFGLLATAEAADHGHLRTVVVLDSHGSGNPASTMIIAGLREELSGLTGVSIAIEHLDLREHDDDDHADLLSATVLHRYAPEDVSVVVTLGDPALRFALQSRGEIFDNAPVIAAETVLEREDFEALPNVTGVLGEHQIGRTLSLIIEQRPDTGTLHIIDDNDDEASGVRRDLDRALIDLDWSPEIQRYSGETLAAMTPKLAALGSEDSVLILTYADKDRHTDEIGSTIAISEAAAVPVYGLFERLIGFGVVGGYLKDNRSLGVILGGMVIDVLAGRDVNSIPVHLAAPHRYIFDFRQLARFKISEDGLPPEAMVIDEPDTFYYRYRRYVWIAVGVVVALIVYIATLLLSIRRRARVQSGLERLLDLDGKPHGEMAGDDVVSRIVARLQKIAPFLQPQAALWLASAEDGAALKLIDGDPGRLSPLIERAASLRSTQQAGRDIVVVLPDNRLPVTLAAFTGRRAPDVIDRRLVDLAARDIAQEFARAEAVRLSAAVETAAAIQDAMLPRDFGVLGADYGVDLHALLRPATEVGGDLYDAFALDEDRLCVLVGDVSGKGVPAALLMAITKTIVRAAAETIHSPGAILAKANDAIERDNAQAMFVTLFLAIYNRRTGDLAYANAGHTPPLLRPVGEAWQVMSVDTNIALGVIPGLDFAEAKMPFPRAAAILLYTDGITEAMTAQGELYGDPRLLSAAGDGSAEAINTSILAAVDRFTAGAPQSDDITLLTLAREA